MTSKILHAQDDHMNVLEYVTNDEIPDNQEVFLAVVKVVVPHNLERIMEDVVVGEKK